MIGVAIVEEEEEEDLETEAEDIEKEMSQETSIETWNHQ